MTLIPSLVFADSSVYRTSLQEEAMKIPTVNDDNLRVELVSNGLKFPTSMAFLGSDDILVLEKNEGTVQRIVNGDILDEPILDVNVSNKNERGMLGISLSKQNEHTDVFLYYTESEKKDGDDPIGNRLYKYQFVDGTLVNRQLLLDLPASPGPYHNSGALTIGPDNNIYLAIGDVDNMRGKKRPDTLAENREGVDGEGVAENREGIDGRAGILRVTQQGQAVGTQVNGGDEDDEDENSDENNSINGILGDEDPLNKYYAYGIRNSFGIDFDPVTSKLWDTENGPGFGDEINLVEPGFNSGWNRVQGIWEYQLEAEEKLREVGRNYYGGPVAPEQPDNLIDFDGKGKYSTPEFTWNHTVGVTSIKFLDSDKLGKDYQNDVFVGDLNNGNLYHFDLSEDRNQLLLDGPLKDRIANNQDELQEAILGHGFNGITDIEVGPDGYLYVLSYAGEIFRISSLE
jgi:aldose sugar dehydrogenase